jgi:hypothetical protein
LQASVMSVYEKGSVSNVNIFSHVNMKSVDYFLLVGSSIAEAYLDS